MGNDILSPVKAVEPPVSPAAQPGIGTIDEPGAAKILDDLCLERFQGHLLILVTRIHIEGQRDTIGVHEQSHGDDRIGTVFLAFPILPAAFRFLYFEVVIGAIIIEDGCTEVELRYSSS